jgi:hypothetical protein
VEEINAIIAKHQASIALLERAKQKKMVERAMIMSIKKHYIMEAVALMEQFLASQITSEELMEGVDQARDWRDKMLGNKKI